MNVPQPHSNREAYLRNDQNFERIPLGLEARMVDGRTMVREWEEWWRDAGRRRGE
jgi:hypothetical protein